ncbi:MAG: VWA domain-containing protein [Anaerolineales bacterium]|nr:VWA domain-containing protein [Anaerolineales bacterium]
MAVTSFQIQVPNKTAAGQLPIMKIRAIVAVETENPVTFTVTDPRGAGFTDTTPAMSPGSAADVLVFAPPPAGAPAVTTILVTPPSCGAVGDPCRRRYEFYFNLDANFDPNNSCASTMAAAETWTIAVSAGSPEITSACLISFDRNIGGQQCVGSLRVVPLTEPVATVVGTSPPQLGCEEERPPVDAVLVLDKSGSMNGSTLGSSPTTKIVALRNAISDFVTIWSDLRATEGAGAPTDNVGVALFDGNASWWAAVPAGLNNFTAVEGTILAQVGTINGGGSTSIGDGMLLADGALGTADATRRRVILLMSDGQQNSDQMIGVVGGQLVSHPKNNPANTTPLPNQNNYQVYAVTVGTSTAVSPQINEDIASTTGGFYINSEDDEALLSPFFLELLQNFVKFNTWETARLVHERVRFHAAPYTTRIPFTSTTQHVAFALRWPARMGVLRLSVLPSGEAQPTQETGEAGFIVLNFDVPTSPLYTFMDPWQVEVSLLDPIGDVQEVPFDLVVLADDAALNSSLDITSQQLRPGDEIQLAASVRELGQLVTGLGGNPQNRLVAQLVRPDTTVGDLLSNSSAPSTPPFQDDSSTPADAKLHNELQQNPGALTHAEDTITLVEGPDGVYRGTYTAEAPGHYNFLFGIEGQTENIGRFTRMQLKTAVVRATPDPASTSFNTTIRRDDGMRLLITMTPRTRFGHLLGPGWATYFWFTTPGQQPVKPVDNLDGTYTATIPFSGFLPPTVSVHFQDVSLVIDDSVPPANLPLPLDASTTFVPSVGRPLPLPLWLLVLLLLFIILLILWLLDLL